MRKTFLFIYLTYRTVFVIRLHRANPWRYLRFARTKRLPVSTSKVCLARRRDLRPLRTVDEATELKGKSTRPSVWKCRACEKPFSVTVGTVFERSKIKLHWVYAVRPLHREQEGL
jgi:hypothetical protein